MRIDIDTNILEFNFQYCQIEITGRCNMQCEHCRASEEFRVDMSLNLFKKIINFVVPEAEKNFRLTISGGEPFLHKGLVKMIKYAKYRGIENILITSNGSVITLKKLNEIKRIGVNKLTIQISVDSIYPENHDKFRNYHKSFNLAMNAFDLIKKAGLTSSLRASITPKKIGEIEELVKLAIKKGAKRIGIGSIIPTGGAKKNKKLLMNRQQKKEFIKKITKCKRKYHRYINVVTEDPLKFAIKNCPWKYKEVNIHKQGFFGGCTAGISGFNVTSEGIITPCSVLPINIVNLKKVKLNKISKIYVNSNIIKNLFRRDFNGKCKNCRLKRICGGCRAVSYGINGNYLGEDTTCFYNIK